MKHGIIDVTGEAPVLDLRGGIFNFVADAATTVFSIQRVPVGYPALIQRIGLGVIFNMVGFHSATGRIGGGVLGKNLYLKV